MAVFGFPLTLFDSKHTVQEGRQCQFGGHYSVMSCTAQHLITHDLSFVKNGKMAIDFAQSLVLSKQVVIFLGSIKHLKLKYILFK